MLSQDAISADTPLGAALVPGGATFKVWAPLASAVYLNGALAGAVFESQSEDRLMIKDALGFWTGFQAGALEGDRYRYWVEGDGSTGFKREPTARELDAPTFPNAYAILRSDSTYPWHDADFRAPDYSAMVVYQAHIGTFATRTDGRSSTLLEVASRIRGRRNAVTLLGRVIRRMFGLVKVGLVRPFFVADLYQ